MVCQIIMQELCQIETRRYNRFQFKGLMNAMRCRGPVDEDGWGIFVRLGWNYFPI